MRGRAPGAAAWLLAGAGALLGGGPCTPGLLLLRRGELREVSGHGDASTGARRAVLALSDPRVEQLAQGGHFDGGGSVPCGVLGGGVDPAAGLRWLWPTVEPEGDPSLLPSTGSRQREKKRRPKRLVPEAVEVTIREELPVDLPQPRVDLLLALPRPGQLERMLPQIAQLGVGSLILCGAAKVEEGYFRSHVLEPETLEQLLAEGLAQAGDTQLPRVVVAPRLGDLLCDGGQLDGLLPRHDVLRLVAHPGRDGVNATEIHRLEPQLLGIDPPRRLLLAVGPEAGWDEPAELDLLTDAGFHCVSAGERVLRSDVAVCALLAIASELMEEWAAASSDVEG